MRSSPGPETVTRRVSISLATMCASVDLPRPGGPASRTWSIGSPRSLAAASAIASCSRTTSWPTNSSSWRGRSERSVSSSSVREAAGADEALVLLAHPGPPRRSAARPALTRSSVVPSAPASAASASGTANPSATRASRAEWCGSSGTGAPERAGLHGLERRGAELVAQLDDDALGGALADARDRCEEREVAGRDAALQRVDRIARDQRKRLGRPEPRDARAGRRRGRARAGSRSRRASARPRARRGACGAAPTPAGRARRAPRPPRR